jgi:hypothetical protein
MAIKASIITILGLIGVSPSLIHQVDGSRTICLSDKSNLMARTRFRLNLGFSQQQPWSVLSSLMVTVCNPVQVHHCFERIYFLRLQGRKVNHLQKADITQLLMSRSKRNVFPRKVFELCQTTFFYHPSLFTICTSTFSKLVEGSRWVSWRRALISIS